ncbi:MAG: XRE family transcriptional regulator [Hydrotalea sp. AMD]|uniref:helix-turn-helix domain-containing protein n=1 Tax=Hydrotalea sp. AMD TaxID=2501297 RepID=UPI001025D71D|nr:helix-turn-helix transcriptional regulator [Hydrotalea sp. AMD]RWZ84311.1 MAG: XRE family transcriptional regulator [Hydrotalea sp. AMD]
MDNLKITASTGNVFEDLGFTDAETMLLKAELSRKISSIIQHKHLSQIQAATLLGVDQPKVSALMNGKLSGFSVERLFRFLTILGRDVRILIKPKSRKRLQGRVELQNLSA